MELTLVEKILSSHSDGIARPGDFIDVRIDARIARDFGGANVIKNINENGLGINDPTKTLPSAVVFSWPDLEPINVLFSPEILLFPVQYPMNVLLSLSPLTRPALNPIITL